MKTKVVVVAQTLKTGDIYRMETFTDNDEGNKEAEAVFANWCKEVYPNEWEADTVAEALENGYLDTPYGGVIQITHSF